VEDIFLPMISISDLISKAKQNSIFLGQGDPREHLSYLSKIGVLPRAVRKRTAHGTIEGHYPESILAKLMQIKEMKAQGVTLSQMGRLGQLTATAEPGPNQTLVWASGDRVYNSLSFLVIGLLLGFLWAKFSPTTPPLGQTKYDLQSFLPESTAKTNLSLENLIKNGTADTIYVLSVPKSRFSNLGDGGKIDLSGKN